MLHLKRFSIFENIKKEYTIKNKDIEYEYEKSEGDIYDEYCPDCTCSCNNCTCTDCECTNCQKCNE